jgi:hypothetical protein
VTKVQIEAQRRTWETPLSNHVTHVAVAMRESMEALGWEFERERTERIYTRFAVILPLPKVAYVFRFRVHRPLDDIRFDTWEMRMTHRGDISFLSIDNYTYEDLPALRRFLVELVGRLPRRPWDFPLGQRAEAGLAIPEWGRAKKQWRAMGFDVTLKTPKEWIPKGILGDRMMGDLGLDLNEDDIDRQVGSGDLVGVGDHEDQGGPDHEQDEEDGK